MTPLPPGSNIGIIGGGQLGRMLALAAAPLGYRIHIYAPESSGPAADVSARWVQGAYNDAKALANFADRVSALTFEFENVETAPLKSLIARVPIAPSLRALEIGQDRVLEKNFASDCGGRTADWMEVSSREDLERAIAKIGTPAILKTRRFGYDGKGQARIKSLSDADEAWQTIDGHPAILEAMVPFDHEFSLIVGRDHQGSVVFWDAPENVHKDGILATSTVPPSPIILQQVPAARALARKMADKLDYIGVFTIEFFASAYGPVFNEMAPRVHNSGHWTIEGAVTSQFENHIRAVAGLPLGPVSLTGYGVTMHNLIGHDSDKWSEIVSNPGQHLHLYGKGEARPGRKMGHVTHVVR